MSAEAALYLSGPDDARVAATAVAGRPLAFRSLMAAVGAGCRRVWVPDVLRHALEDAVAATPSARTAVVWLDPGASRAPAPLLLMPAAALAPASALSALLAAPVPAVLGASRGCGAPIATLAPADAEMLWDDVAAGKAIGGRLDRMLADAGAAVIDGGWYAPVAGPLGAAAAEAVLYASLGSSIDTRLDRAFHRRLSRPLTRLAVQWGLAPNHVTAASLLVGLAAAWCFWEASAARAVAGLALYAAAVVLDHADGEVARVTFAESALGRWLDVVVDTVVHVTLVLALGATAQHAAGSGGIAGVVAAIGVIASTVVTQRSPAIPRDRSGAAAAVLTTLGNRDGYYAMLVAFVIFLAVLPAALPPFMLLVAAGCHMFSLTWLVHSSRTSDR